jgi:hypothetical protein
MTLVVEGLTPILQRTMYQICITVAMYTFTTTTGHKDRGPAVAY